MNTHTVNTAMREAFDCAAITKTTGAAIVNTCLKAMKGKAGQIKVRDWNASLSFDTAKKLNAPHFMDAKGERIPYMRTRFDNMAQATVGEE